MVTVEDLDVYKTGHKSLASWLTWQSSRWYLELLNEVSAAGFERRDAYANVPDLVLANNLAFHRGSTLDEVRHMTIEAAVRLSELPVDHPITVEVHRLCNALAAGAEDVYFHLGQSGEDISDIPHVLGLRPVA